MDWRAGDRRTNNIMYSNESGSSFAESAEAKRERKLKRSLGSPHIIYYIPVVITTYYYSSAFCCLLGSKDMLWNSKKID